MKIHHAAFASLFIALSSEACIVGSTERSSTGNLFKCIGNDRRHGEIWQDASGRKWGDLIRDADGAVMIATQAAAVRFCSENRGRLPEARDFAALRMLLGARTPDTPNGYIPGVLPNLVLNSSSSNWIWSSTQHFHFDLGSNMDYYIFDSHYGGISEADINPQTAGRVLKLRFRCLL